jgi:excinuclease ABC subunit C
MTMPNLADRAAALPTTSGVYLFRDASGQVLYVGKAKNLRSRVRQYLAGQDGRFMVRFLVAQSADVEVVLTDTEKDALLLENTLIKRHNPRYNVKLRDDKNFLHLRVRPKSRWPRYTLVRRIHDDGSRTFGPYSSAQRARRTLDFVHRTFQLRTCTDAVLRSRQRPCMLHQMGRCVAPCIPGHTTPEAYGDLVRDSMLFLEGRNSEVVDRLRQRMRTAAEREEFEDAARLRDLIQIVERALERQRVVDRGLGDRDVWGIFRELDRGVAVVIPVRAGMMLEPAAIPFEGLLEELPELLSTLLNTWYGGGRLVPPEILVPTLPADGEALAELLTEIAGRKVRLHQPLRGDKLRLTKLALRNARDRYQRSTERSDRLRKALTELRDLLDLPDAPRRIECFDNSNFQGDHPVSSQVVFLNGEPAKKEYRTYKIRTVVGPDDYATMAEVLGRRFRRATEEGIFPDLLVVDGGRGQLNVALKVLEELGISDQPVIGLAKPRTEKKRGDADPVDKIIVPGRTEPILLPDHHPSLNLLRHIRDESHRFAIRFHRQIRRKSTLTSVLEEIPGIGPTRRKALLRHFGSARALGGATMIELAAVPGIGRATARQIREALDRAKK